MKSLLISCLIFTLSLECFHSTTAATASAKAIANTIRRLQVDPAAPNIVAKIQSNPIKDPEGAALILIDRARANVRSTTAFLNQNMKKNQEDDVMGRLQGCLLGYNALGHFGINNIDRASLDTRDGRSQVLQILSNCDEEITYDCGWQILEHFPPIVNELNDMVADFSSTLGTASGIISSIDE